MKRLILLLSMTQALILVATSSSGSESIQLKISAAKTSLILYEPLVLDVILANEGGKDVAVIQQMDIIYSVYRYCISTNGVDFIEIGPRIFFDWEPRPSPLNPGSQARHEQFLLYDGCTGRAIFPVPGEYYIKVRLVRGMLLDSNVVKLKVAEIPAKEKESQTCKKISENQVLVHLQWPSPQGKAIDDELKKCLESENNAYSPYLAFVLASRAIRHKVTDESYTKLIDRADVDGFPLRSTAIYWKGILSRNMNAKETRNNEFERLKQQFPNSYAAWRLERDKAEGFSDRRR